MITTGQPLSISEIGRKDNQEDSLYPTPAATPHNKIFILCDGMGGHERGEVASGTVASALGEALESELSAAGAVTREAFGAALEKAFCALDSVTYSSDKKPGTTMTCLCINPDSCLVAHIGDSRIYHIRPSLFNDKRQRGGILYQSEDHSLVNRLIKAGELTIEESVNFKHRNVITRAMQPGASPRPKADVYEFDDIKGGDYFFLCSDGVLEQLSNERLCAILADSSLRDEAKMRAIEDICGGKTRDNYSCWLIPVRKGVRPGRQQVRPGHIVAEISKPRSCVSLSRRALAVIIYICCAAIAAIAIFLAFSRQV